MTDERLDALERGHRAYLGTLVPSSQIDSMLELISELRELRTLVRELAHVDYNDERCRQALKLISKWKDK